MYSRTHTKLLNYIDLKPMDVSIRLKTPEEKRAAEALDGLCHLPLVQRLGVYVCVCV